MIREERGKFEEKRENKRRWRKIGKAKREKEEDIENGEIG